MEFTKYQRWMWTCLSYLTVCRFYIAQDSTGRYSIRETGKFRRFLYYVIWVNTSIKITYLILTYQGWLGIQVGFLDQMSMWDWFLCFSQLVQETNLWYRKYPLYEVLHANWSVQEEIFRKLGRPTQVDSKLTQTFKSLVKMHSVIIFIGCGAIACQFFVIPKFALNTYALFSYDAWGLRILFAAHEYIYIYHIWIHQASSIVLIEVFSVTYTTLLKQMTQVMEELSKFGKVNLKSEVDSDEELSGSAMERKRSKRFIPDRDLNPHELLPGTHYSVNILLQDYKKTMIAAQQFNAWAGKLMGGTMMSNYGQFVSDVFMMIQLLKEPDVDLMGVAFFFEDACAGMTILIRMLILMSRVYPSSEEFLSAFKTYLHHDHHQRKYLVKYNKTLRIVATKIGGYSTNPSTVPNGINNLMNYYIMAAMWQRPDASTGRRT